MDINQDALSTPSMPPQPSDRSAPAWLAEHHPELVHALSNWLRCVTTGVPETTRSAAWHRVEKYLLKSLNEGEKK